MKMRGGTGTMALVTGITGLIWQQSGAKIVPTDLWTNDKIEVEGTENQRI